MGTLSNRARQMIADGRRRDGLSYAESWQRVARALPGDFGLPESESCAISALCNRLQVERGGSFEENWNLAQAQVYLNGRSQPSPDALLMNRSFSPSADGWLELLKTGEFPIAGGPVQVIDDQALRAMLAAFDRDQAQPNFPGLLLDYDHQSYDAAKSSEAAGWINDLRVAGDTLLARPDWTSSGEAAIAGGLFRLVSPTFRADQVEKLGNNRVRPLRLDSVALTNSPNMRGLAPLSR